MAVGAIAHAAVVPNHGPGMVSVRPIAQVGEPAPFTRSGPGIHDAIKPELCDDGGHVLFDGVVQGLSRYSESEVFTTHPRYLERLFTTAKGTSYAAPLVAHTRADYLGVQMSFRLVRGKSLEEVIDFYKKRDQEVDGDEHSSDLPPEISTS